MGRLRLLLADLERLGREIEKLVKEALKKQLNKPDTPKITQTKGTYKNPDYTGRQPGVLPKELRCGESFVIYIAEATWENTCVGFGGPNDDGNANCTTALATAQAAAAQVTCPAECPKQVVEIWRGWGCTKGPNDPKNWAICAVELEVSCPITE
jgi:hypothetical protein